MFVKPCRNSEIRMVRGTSQLLEIRVTDGHGAPYVLSEGDVIRFGVKYEEGNGAYLVKKQSSTLTDGITRIHLTPEDTMEMEPGRYKFDIGLQTGEDYFPVVAYSDFILVPNVTEKEV